AITRSKVDLPLPLGPSSATSPPLSTVSETESSATKSPKRFETSRTSIAIDPLLGLEDAHRDQGQYGQSGQEHGARVGPGQVEGLVGVLDVSRQRLGLAGDPARDDADGAELPERAGGGEDDAVCDRPEDRRQRDPPEHLERRRAERRGGLLLLGADLAQHRHHLADDEGERDEDRREHHRRKREEHPDAVVEEEVAEPAAAPVEQEEREPDDDRREREREVDDRVDDAHAREAVPHDRERAEDAEDGVERHGDER